MASFFGITPGRIPVGRGNGLPLKGKVTTNKPPKAPVKKGK